MARRVVREWRAGRYIALPMIAQLVADLASQEQERHDRDNRDQGEDECVFGETLAILVIARDERPSQVHQLR